jgi:hypothetical protein
VIKKILSCGTLTITAAVIVVPLIGLPFAIPMFLSYNVFGF